jgi:hypothetical protein
VDSRWGSRRPFEHLRGACLVELDLSAAALLVVADGLQKPEGSKGDDVGGVFGLVEGYPDVGLGAEIVYLVRLDGLDDPSQPARVAEVPVVELERASFSWRSL